LGTSRSRRPRLRSRLFHTTASGLCLVSRSFSCFYHAWDTYQARNGHRGRSGRGHRPGRACTRAGVRPHPGLRAPRGTRRMLVLPALILTCHGAKAYPGWGTRLNLQRSRRSRLWQIAQPTRHSPPQRGCRRRRRNRTNRGSPSRPSTRTCKRISTFCRCNSVRSSF
jgi:hypothetical protein